MPQERKYASSSQRQAAYRQRQEHARAQQLRQKGLPPLPAIPTIPGWPRWNASIRYAAQMLETTLSEMQDYYDERSEQWQEDERGEEHQQKLDAVQTALDAVSELT